MSKRAARWPKRVSVGGVPYRAEWRPHVEEDGRGYWGMAEYGTRTISISQKDAGGAARSGDDMFVTLLHEMIHAVLEEAPLLRKRVKGGGGREAFVKTLATILGGALLDTGLVRLPEGGQAGGSSC